MKKQSPPERKTGGDSRPVLNRRMGSETFREYYYLKEELVKFCRENHLINRNQYFTAADIRLTRFDNEPRAFVGFPDLA